MCQLFPDRGEHESVHAQPLTSTSITQRQAMPAQRLTPNGSPFSIALRV